MAWITDLSHNFPSVRKQAA